MLSKSILLISIILSLAGCSTDDDTNNKYSKEYYSSIDYSDIDSVSSKLIDKLAGFKDLSTPIKILDVKVIIGTKTYTLGYLEEGDSGDSYVYDDNGSMTFSITEGANSVINFKDIDEGIDITRTFTESSITTTVDSITKTEIRTFDNSPSMTVIIPDSIVINGNAIVEYDSSSKTITIRDGDLGLKVFNKVVNFIKNNNDIKEVRLKNINGSISDEINMQTGFAIRKAGLKTSVDRTNNSTNTDIASGGVDLFVTGVKREILNNAKLGVHSWSGENDKGDEVEGKDFAKNHKNHHDQLLFFITMLGLDNGYDFYFYTLDAANASDMHTMTPSEITKYAIEKP